MTKKLILQIVKIVLPLLLGGYLIWYSFSMMSPSDEKQFYITIKEANYFWIFISMLLGFIAFLSRAQRWKYSLEPLGYSPKFWHRYHALMIGYLINFTIPRAGEASRAAMLYRSDEIPFSTSFGSVMSERAVDLIILISLTIITALIGYADFFEIVNQIKMNQKPGSSANVSSFPWKMIILSLMGIGAVILTYLFIKKEVFRIKLIGFIKEVLAGLFSIFKLKQPLAYICHTILIWSCFVLMFALPFYALEQTNHFPVTGIFIGFIAGSIGIIITPGGIGTYPMMVSLVVGFYIGKEYENGLGIGNALGWIMWLSQTLMTIILGVISFILLPKNFSSENGKTSIPSSETSNDI
jgi:uncharacterized protein (TIRG00374 family)